MAKESARFRKTIHVGTVLLAAGLVLGTVHAEEGKIDVNEKDSRNVLVEKVELLFLGTGAADWSRRYPPAERQLDRGEVRGMSSILVNGHILIDCGPTVLDAMRRYEVNPADIAELLITHSHADHFHPESILAIADARDVGLGALRVWAHPEVLKRLPESERIEKCPVVIGKVFQAQGLDITGLKSNHHVENSKETCLLYLIEDATIRALYATDTAWLLKSTWLHLQGKPLDALIWDTTIGEKKGDYRIFEHNDLTMIRHMNHTLKNAKIIKPETKIILTHMARTLHPSHDKLEAKLLPEGLIPAYDGMSVILE